MTNNYEFQITQVIDKKGSMIEYKYLATVNNEHVAYGNTALDAYENVRHFLEKENAGNIL
jgi:hypothetical protein